MNSTNNQHTEDKKWMKRALELAAQGAGYTAPNPMVGCVIVSKSGELIGEGYHQKYGEDHAEVNAVNNVEDPSKLEGATAYVTLEPCSHQGKTPPCAPMLAQKGISRVVVAMKDPNPQVNGNGLLHLRNQGVEVTTGVLKEEAEALNEFFIHRQSYGRPFITLKVAQTADGYTAAADGHSKWISGKESRKMVHQWRSVYDAVMVGRNTALLDNPSLTVRHVSGRQPRRIVIDGPYKLPRELNLFSDQYEEKTTVLTWNREASSTDADPMLKVMQQNYFRGEVLQVPKTGGYINLREAFSMLGDKGITSILVEGGQQLSSALAREGLIDKLHLFIAPKLLGAGTRSFINIGIDKMTEIADLKDVSWKQVGDDILLTGYF